jgi:hypothetical protein
MTHDEEREYLITEFQWARMRLNEASANWQIAFYRMQEISQALLDHLKPQQGTDNDNSSNTSI